MPLDGHQFLVSQGWSGKGTGLRQGAITRPITITQKKNLGGLGKDRDEAFPFWDHLYTTASKTINVKIYGSDDSDVDSATPLAPVLKRTSTGILSNRRPIDLPSTSTSASTSGASTPDLSSSMGPRLSLIAQAKREAAKRHLYSKFYRGLVLAPDVKLFQPIVSIAQSPPTKTTESVELATGSLSPPSVAVNNSDNDDKKRKRKRDTDEGDAERQKRKRLKKERKKRKELNRKEREERKGLKVKAKSERQEKRERKGKRKMKEVRTIHSDESDADKEERKRLKSELKEKKKQERKREKDKSL